MHLLNNVMLFNYKLKISIVILVVEKIIIIIIIIIIELVDSISRILH